VTGMPTPDPPPVLNEIVDRIGGAARDAAAVTIGLGILGINRIQVLRREATTRLDEVRARTANEQS
jgi:hypothetical protein